MTVAEFAYNDLDEHNELFTMKDELPEKLTRYNSINTLQKLAQKGYFSIPKYLIPEQQSYDINGNPIGACICNIRSYSLTKITYASSKKKAKKYAAYLCIINIFGMHDEYED